MVRSNTRFVPQSLCSTMIPTRCFACPFLWLTVQNYQQENSKSILVRMSCFCLNTKSRSGKDDSLHQTHVNEFYKMMLGEIQPSSMGDVIGQKSNGILDEFSTINASSNLTAGEIAVIATKYKASGLIRLLAPYVHDTIRRKASLSMIAQLLNNSGCKEFQGITGRDLFVASALACSDTVRLYSVAAAVPGMALPLVIPGPVGEPLALWDAFADLLSFPRGALVLSVGTAESRNMGKSTLLRQIGLCGLTKSYEALGGKLGGPAVDIYFSDNHGPKTVNGKQSVETVVADCSGLPLTDPTMCSLMAAAAVAIVHVYPKDVSDKAGPSKELKELLGSGRSRWLIVLIRDSESWKPQCRGILDATIDAFKASIAITIEVPNYLKSSIDRVTIYKTVYNNVQSVWGKVLKGCYTPSLSILRKGGNGSSPNKTVMELTSPLSRELWALLDEEKSGNRVSTKTFPFSTANTRLLQLKRDERRVREDGGVDCEQALTLIAKERGSWNSFLASSQPSRTIQWFCRIINLIGAGDSWKLARLAFEINETLDEWKQPQIEPLMKQQRELMDAGDMKGAQEIHAQIEELNISMDSFWTELEVLTSPDSPWEQATVLEADIESIHQAFAYSILAGAPVQLLKGTPLRLTDTAFLKSILAAGTASMGKRSAADQQIVVVSVIGAQSSAKSTLLNFLFGCNFVTRAGRCTRGLYASFLRLDDGRLMVVLDTEGLLSIESNPGESGDVFDGQMTLLAMACSQLVLINHKGEVSRQLQDLLEVCMFALKHLRVTNFQPDIFFVLRDQHDRSPTVHEDMLRHMKRHLSGCANRLGLKLEDVLRLNASSIHLLPSAYVSQILPMNGKEVPMINEAFPEEVLRLRASVMGVLNETIARQADSDTGRMGAWHTLEQWYTHCNTVWETLTQFGHNLLHYKTIREIEVKRELGQIAGDVSRHVLENGFKPEATQVLQQYVDERLKGTVEDLETADVELRTSLGKLREFWAEKLVSTFDTQTGSQERFSATMRQDVGARLPAVLDYVYDNLLYTWKLHLKQAKDSQQATYMWTHFCKVLDKVLFSDPTKMAVVSESEARQLFAREWTSYEAEFMQRLEGIKKSKMTIAYEVAVVFNSALVKACHERPDYQLLKEAGPQALLQASQTLMNDEADDLWKLKYLAPAAAGGYDNRNIDETSRDIRTLRKLVLDMASDVESEILRTGAMATENIALDWLRTAHDIAFRDGERRMKVCKVRQPQVLAALQSELRIIAFTALCREEDNRHKKQVDNLLKQRKDIEEHLVMMAKGNAGDVDRAGSFADRYHKQIDQWLDRQVTAFAAEVRATVLSEMPDPAKAHERAFQQSFGARNWMDVLEYCLDVNAYLEKMFLTLFHRRQVAVIATRLPELEQKIRDMYGSLRELVAMFYKENSLAIASGQRSAVGLSIGGSGKRIFDFKEFLQRKGLGSQIVGIENDVTESVAEIFPPTVNFEIRDLRVFSEAFREQILGKLGSLKDSSISKRVQKSLQEQSVQAWSMIRGCTGRCPLCGSKCDCLGEHQKHSCSHHLFPAFHGWMDRATGAPSLAFCKSEDVYSGTYQCRDGEWRGLAEYLDDSHPSWVPFPRGGGEFDEDVTVLRAAWVNCKFALEKYFTPMKSSNPPQWECYVEPGRQLTAGDLETAKKVIRAIRGKTWVPVIPALKEVIGGTADAAVASQVTAA